MWYNGFWVREVPHRERVVMGVNPGDLKVWFASSPDIDGGHHHAKDCDDGNGNVLCQMYRLPKKFYDHHDYRDLPAGVVERSTNQHVFVWLSHIDNTELISDAQYYADPDGPPGYVASARSMLRALGAE